MFMKTNCLYQHCIVFGMLNLVINYEINKVKKSNKINKIYNV